MWRFEQFPISADHGVRVRVMRGGRAVDVQAFASGLRDEVSVRDSFVEQIANCPYDAMFWETPPFTRSTLSSPFEYVRQAPRARVHELLGRVGQCLLERVGDDPSWLSSSGLGVAWLHLRLDSRPKYYNHKPYRIWPRPDPREKSGTD